MKITRERYLDDSDRWLLTLDLVSRTPEMHSALDALSPEAREALGDVLVEALEKAARIVEPVTVERSVAHGSASAVRAS